MARFDGLARSARLSKMTVVASSRVDAIRSRYPWLPDEYLEFLRDVGAGEIGESSLMVYDSPVPAETIFGHDTIPGVLAIGDDFQGYVFGYSPSAGGSIVEIEPGGFTLDVVALSFADFIRGRLAD